MRDIRNFLRRTIGTVLWMLLFPLAVVAGEIGERIPDKPAVPDSILQNIFQFSPFYSRIVDEYKADVYMKGRVKVLKSNKLFRYIPSLFRLEEGIDDYIVESMSEMHYTAPDIYSRKINAMATTFPRNRADFADLTDFLNINVYSSSLLTDRLLSPLDRKSAPYYTYLLDSIVGSPDCRRYKILIYPKFRATQLVSGYVWVSDQVWTIREAFLTGEYNMLRFTLRTVMGEEGDEEFLPVRMDMGAEFKFMGNHITLNLGAWMKYNKVLFYTSGKRRKSQKKHSHDLTEFYDLVIDSTRTVNDRELFGRIRPIPLDAEEDSLYRCFQVRKDTAAVHTAMEEEQKPKSAEFWGHLGDMLISSYNVNLAGLGSVRCSPLINPVMLSYSHSKGISYKQKFKYNRLFPSGRMLRVTPQIGYNFTHREFYAKGDVELLYWPEKMGSIDLSVGNGDPIYSSVVVDRLQNVPDSLLDFDDLKLDYFNDVHLDLFHTMEPVNGLLVKAGVTMHWRTLVEEVNLEHNLKFPMAGEWLEKNGIRSRYNSFAPRIRLEWTPGMYYYMNGRRKMNVGSEMPTFVLDYERGLKGVLGSNDEHERVEFDVQQKIKLNKIRSLGYRAGFGLFTKMDNVYFVDFVNFSRSNLPVGWNDEIGGTFQLLDKRWYNSSRRYWRANATYESPFILFRPLNRWLQKIQQERLYGGILFMPHLNPYVELGYGIGTHIFDVGVFVSSINGSFDTVGFKFTFELFRD